MRLYEFDNSQVAQTIWRDCQPFIQAGGIEHPAYRGIHYTKAKPTGTPMMVKKGRNPLNTSYEVHQLIDAFFSRAFGIRFRSNTVFVTGNPVVAEEYGDLYLVFPIGNFDYCWSPMVADMYEDMPSEFDSIFDEADPDANAKVLSWVRSQKYRANVSISDFAQALQSNNEIMIHCDKFYAVPIDDAGGVIDQLKTIRGGNNEGV